MTNVLIIPTSGLMEFNASAGAGGFSGTLDNSYANAVRLDLANSATLRVLGKNATNNERLVVSGTNGVVLKVRDVSAAGSASASVETPIMSATYVSAGTVSATNYLNLPLLGEGQFVDVSGDTMTGQLILSGATQTTLNLSSNGAAYFSGNVSSAKDFSAAGNVIGSSGTFPVLSGNTRVAGDLSATGAVSAAGAVRGLSGIFTHTVSAATALIAPAVSATTEVSAPTVKGISLSGGTLVLSGTVSATGNISSAGAISSTGNQLSLGDMSSAGSHRGLSGIFTHTVSAATALIAPAVSATTEVSAPTVKGISLSGGTLVLSGTVNAAGNISSAGEISSTGAHRGSSGIFAHTVSAATALIAPAVSATTEVSAPTVKGISLSGGTLVLSGTVNAAGNISGATFSGASITLTGNASVANLSATGNVSSASSFSLSANHANLSSTNISATNVTGINAKFPNASANNLSVSVVDAGAVSGAAPTDLILRSLAGDVNVTAANTIVLNATAVDIPAGDLSVTGNFKATAKSFLIDHPTPNSGFSKLQYACLEGPENGVYVRGKADTQVGVIELPYYWMDLVHAESITVQLTAMSPAQRLYVAKIEDNKVYVKDASAVSEVTTFFYTVNGERKDIGHLTVEY